SAFNVLVFPDDDSGRGESYADQLDSLAVDRIKRWARTGNVFIGLKGGAAWATADISGLTGVKLKPEKDEDKDDDKDKEKKKEEDLAKKLMTVDEKEKSDRLKQIPG